MRKFSYILLLACVLAWALPPSLCAQDLGNVGLRTVNAILANGTACTGSAQTFATTNTTLNNAGFRNLGQTSHVATATSNATQFQMEIDGIDSLGNVFRISDLQLGVPSSAKGGLVVTGGGNFANIQVSVTCTAAATFSVSYSGSFSPIPPNLAGALLTAVEKLPFQTAAANATTSTTFQTPSGNSSGTIVFQYSAGGPSGSTVTVQCITNGNTNLASFVFNLTTASTAQLFTVTPSSCPFVTLTYTSGGASAVTYNLEYAFNLAGTQATLNTPNSGPASTSSTQVVSDALAQAFIATPAGVVTNPANGQLILHVNDNSAVTKSLYFDKLLVSCSAACNIAINLTSTLGTTCTGITPANQKIANSTVSIATAQTGTCGGNPGVFTTYSTNTPLAAGTPVQIDLRGLIAPAGGTTGVAVTMAAALTGTIAATMSWYEK